MKCKKIIIIIIKKNARKKQKSSHKNYKNEVIKIQKLRKEKLKLKNGKIKTKK